VPPSIKPLANKSTASELAGESKGPEMVALKDHPKYSKYLKMVKVGLPRDAVKSKMSQEGVDPNILDRDPDEQIPLNDAVVESDASKEKSADSSASVTMVPVAEHPAYSKYFRMLKVGLPSEAVKAKMTQEGVNPAFLDKSPTDLIPLEAEEEKIAVKDHPVYSKYFKMLKVGLPREAVKAKMSQEGANPIYLDKDPDELIPLDDKKKASVSAASKAPSPVAKKEPKVRKKRLHWRALDASKVGRDSLWADNDGTDIFLDEAEFNQLFVESGDEPKVQEKPNKPAAEQKKQRINLIDMKRGQNGGIALARIRLEFEEVKQKIMVMDDKVFTTDQLISLKEFLPTHEEADKLALFTGDRTLLGQAEKYMLVMKDFPSAAQRIKCMIYKQQFNQRVMECRSILSKIENACDDVKMSIRLKKVLKTILKVGNQMNEGAEYKGFTLDSLLKLQSAKAFDKKTSILQYVIMLIHRNDTNCLLFPEDLPHVGDASRLTLDSVQTERSGLRQGLEENCAILERLKDAENSTEGMNQYLKKVILKKYFHELARND
jgi:Formin Homology 2 Domain/Subunit CCDC53 of WASH complex